MALLKILGALLLTLLVLVPLLQRFGKPLQPEQQANMSRWLMILMAVSALLATARYLEWF
jgi:hypothetical protein